MKEYDFARLVLDFIKVLIWPIIALLAILLFRAEIAELTKRAESLSAGPLAMRLRTAATGGEKANPDRLAPEMWFDFLKIDVTHTECLAIGEEALIANGFKEGGINNGNTAYGYYEQYVGAIWCIEPLRQALVAVSGPSSQIASQKVTVIKELFQRHRR